jgi:hypothetical protein
MTPKPNVLVPRILRLGRHAASRAFWQARGAAHRAGTPRMRPPETR